MQNKTIKNLSLYGNQGKKTNSKFYLTKETMENFKFLTKKRIRKVLKEDTGKYTIHIIFVGRLQYGELYTYRDNNIKSLVRYSAHAIRNFTYHQRNLLDGLAIKTLHKLKSFTLSGVNLKVA